MLCAHVHENWEEDKSYVYLSSSQFSLWRRFGRQSVADNGGAVLIATTLSLLLYQLVVKNSGHLLRCSNSPMNITLCKIFSPP